MKPGCDSWIRLGVGEKLPHVELTSLKATSLTPVARISQLLINYKFSNHSPQVKRVNCKSFTIIYHIYIYIYVYIELYAHIYPIFSKPYLSKLKPILRHHAKNTVFLQVPLMKRLPRDERPIVAEACEACEFQNGDVPCRKEHFAEISTNGFLQRKNTVSFLDER